jgi:heme exporter protein C
MRTIARSRHADLSWLVDGLLLAAVLLAIGLIFWYAPTEETMGHVQRIVYFHVSVAWCGLAGSLLMGMFAVIYLVRRDLRWDAWSQAAGELGWLGTTLTLVTGSLWAHEAWGVWWTWEPRLTFSLVLWLIFAGIFLVRSGVEDSSRRARLSAIVAVIGAADTPLVFMATRWFRGVHPVAPEMDPSMRLVLIVALLSFSAFFARLLAFRRRQIGLLEAMSAMEMHRLNAASDHATM